MAGETKLYDDRELARRVVELGNHCRAIPGTRGLLQRLTPAELEYLEWLYAETHKDDSAA